MNDVNRHAGRMIYEPVGYLDDDPAKLGKELGGVKVLGPLTSAGDFGDCWFVNGLNGTTLMRRKRALIEATGIPRERFATIVHPSASVSQMAITLVSPSGTCT